MMANKITRNLPRRIEALQVWKHDRAVTTRELASILKEPVEHVASALSRMKMDGKMVAEWRGNRAYWRPAVRQRNPALSIPFLTPSGMALAAQLERQNHHERF